MIALLLAAGIGSRLSPITLSRPKCLVEIRGMPLLGHWLQTLRESELFTRVLINTHHRSWQVEAFINESPHADWVTLSYEETLLGSVGTLVRHKNSLSDSDFLVAHADNLSIIDWPAFSSIHSQRQAELIGTMMTFATDDPKSCGIVEVDETGTLQKMHEKVDYPTGNIANAAVYLFNPSLFEIIGAHTLPPPSDISRDLVPLLYGRLATFFNSKYHRDIGTPTSLNAAQIDFPLN